MSRSEKGLIGLLVALSAALGTGLGALVLTIQVFLLAAWGVGGSNWLIVLLRHPRALLAPAQDHRLDHGQPEGIPGRDDADLPGALKPIVDRAFSLKDGAEPQRLLAEGKQFGKLVLVP